MRSPPAWATVTCNVPATLPAKLTTPSLAARTGVPAAAARSAPRWPGAVDRGGLLERVHDRAVDRTQPAGGVVGRDQRRGLGAR